jgi:hypothetical protein
VWNPYYGVHFNRIEAIQNEFLRFALRTLGWSRDIEISPYCQRCRLIDLYVLSDVLSCKLGCPIILSSLRLNVHLYNTRYSFLHEEDPHRTNYGMNEPLYGAKGYLMNF